MSSESEPSAINSNTSGGVNTGGDTTVGGDVVGRDKIVTGNGGITRIAVIGLAILAALAVIGLIVVAVVPILTIGSSYQLPRASAPVDNGTSLPSNLPPTVTLAHLTPAQTLAPCLSNWSEWDRPCLGKTPTEWDLVTPEKPDRICTETLDLAQPVFADGIHITLTQRANSAWGYSLYEVEIYGPDNPQKNLAHESFAHASSVEELDSSFAYTPSFAIDGEMFLSDINGNPSRASRWASDQQQEDPQWLSITLPVATKINRVVLKWEPAYAKDYCVTIIPGE